MVSHHLFAVTTKQVILFAVFNSILPFTDMFTDLLTSFGLYEDGHVRWATLTFVVMWNPFFIHLAVFLFDLITYKPLGKDFVFRVRILALCTHIPFVLPIKNLNNTVHLIRMKFGSPDFEDSNWANVEEIQREAGIGGMYESFTEAGPQAVIQLVVIFCTGEISTAQYFSIPSSLLSLGWTSARAYFIQRGEERSDPDPKVKVVALHIFPYELAIVLNSVILWTLIGGLLGMYIFVAITGSCCFTDADCFGDSLLSGIHGIPCM